MSSNLQATQSFFSAILDFETTSIHNDYLTMRRDTVHLHFSKVGFIDKKKNNCACYIQTDDVDGVYKKSLELNCVHPNGKLSSYPWGREFAILDPDGNLIKVKDG